MILLRYFSMPSSMLKFFYRVKSSQQPTTLTMGELMFWQEAMTDLRDNFYTFSIKPVTLPTAVATGGEAPYAAKELELNWHKAHLLDRTERHLPFLLSLARTVVPFSILTRYLVFNQITGMFHLFHFQQAPESDSERKFFSDHFFAPAVARRDIKLYLLHYFDQAFKTVGEAARMASLTPLEALAVMRSFWHLTGCAQDTIVICLEVQQLHLYRQLKKRLFDWHKLLPLLSDKSLSAEHHNHLRQLKFDVLIGAKFAEKDNDYSQAFFVDILARMVLFWGCVCQLKVFYPKERAPYLALQQQFPESIDLWEGIEFGNIAERDQQPLTETLYAGLLADFKRQKKF